MVPTAPVPLGTSGKFKACSQTFNPELSSNSQLCRGPVCQQLLEPPLAKPSTVPTGRWTRLGQARGKSRASSN